MIVGQVRVITDGRRVVTSLYLNGYPQLILNWIDSEEKVWAVKIQGEALYPEEWTEPT